jgi:hypothetical protein
MLAWALFGALFHFYNLTFFCSIDAVFMTVHAIFLHIDLFNWLFKVMSPFKVVCGDFPFI